MASATSSSPIPRRRSRSTPGRSCRPRYNPRPSEDDKTIHFVIPPKPANSDELSEEDLEKVAGGIDHHRRHHFRRRICHHRCCGGGERGDQGKPRLVRSIGRRRPRQRLECVVGADAGEPELTESERGTAGACLLDQISASVEWVVAFRLTAVTQCATGGLAPEALVFLLEPGARRPSDEFVVLTARGRYLAEADCRLRPGDHVTPALAPLVGDSMAHRMRRCSTPCRWRASRLRRRGRAGRG